MAAMGLIEETYRLPLVPPGAAARDQIMKVLQDLKLLGSAARRVPGVSRTMDGSSRTVDPVSLARTLIDIDSTTGREGRRRRVAGAVPSRARLPGDRTAGVGRPLQRLRPRRIAAAVVFSTHFDCVPPFFPSREERGLLFGRGSCDAKGILAAQVAAAERLRARGRDARRAAVRRRRGARQRRRARGQRSCSPHRRVDT